MKKKLLAWLLVVMMVLSMLPVPALAAGNEQESSSISETLIQENEQTVEANAVTYLSPVYKTSDDPTSGLKEMEMKVCNSYTEVTMGTSVLSNGWYVVKGTIEQPKKEIQVEGEVHLILADGSTLKIENLRVSSGNSLNIYTQSSASSEQQNSCGKLICEARRGKAGIGGGASENNGPITINGGDIQAKGGNYYKDNDDVYLGGAGIGGGYYGKGTNIIINGGIIKAVGGEAAAGIGGGFSKSGKNSDGEHITINSSNVTASTNHIDCDYSGAGIGGGRDGDGCDIQINDSTVHSNGGIRGAGIGGGDEGNGRDITITNSTVYANGDYGGAGIGGGNHGEGLNITIDNSTVEAKGDYDGAGIGGGEDRKGKNILIQNNSTVKAWGGAKDGGAGIGGGQDGNGEDIKISASTVYAWGGADSAGIGSGEGQNASNIVIEYSYVEARGEDSGAGIGGGENGKVTNITISGRNTRVIATGGQDAAGIGSGYKSKPSENIQILGGKIKAYGGNDDGGAGIGGGYKSKINGIYFENCEVLAIGGTKRADGVGSAQSAGRSSNIKISTKDAKLKLYLNGKNRDFGSGDLGNLLYNINKVEIKNTDYVPEEHEHNWTYTADGSFIYADCQNETGHESCSPEFVELCEPDNLLYDGEKKEVFINGFIDGVELPAVQYYQGETLLADAPTEIGSYTAKLTLGNATAVLDFEIEDSGEIQTIDLTKVSTATFISEAPFDTFKKVKVDGDVVDEQFYEVREGSTIITLNKDFLNTLSNGLHTISIVSEKERADFLFNIVRGEEEPTPSPQTEDTNSTPNTGISGSTNTLWIVFLLLAAAVVCVFVISRRQKSVKR